VTRVAITGWGSVSALGGTNAEGVAGLRTGKRPLAFPRRSPHLVRAGDVLVAEALFDAPIERRARAMVETAVDEALDMAPEHAGVIGVFAGTTGGFFVDAEVDLLFARRDDPEALPAFGQRGQGELAEEVARYVGAYGPVLTFCTACTSSAAAMASAARHLRAGTCARAVVVGFDLLSSLTVQGFRSLLLCDPEPCRPFDTSRAGLQLGEGCGVLVLDADGEGPFTVRGSANRIDPSHLTASAADGSMVEAVIREAVRDDDIVSIKAHGTGTRDNDLAEGRGIARVWEEPPPFASLKGSLGHTLGAAGALETALWLGCLREGFLPASQGFAEADPEIGVAPITQEIPARSGAHLFNAFGFGGSCIALVVADA